MTPLLFGRAQVEGLSYSPRWSVFRFRDGHAAIIIIASTLIMATGTDGVSPGKELCRITSDDSASVMCRQELYIRMISISTRGFVIPDVCVAKSVASPVVVFSQMFMYQRQEVQL